jgi:PAS domain S-box-containing protein
VTVAHAQPPEGQAARKVLATTFAESPWGMALTTLDGRFLEANAAYCRMVGYTLEELRALDLMAITHTDDRAESGRRLQAAPARDPGDFTWEKRYIRKDGQIVSVRDSVSIFRGEHHEPVYLVGIFEDLSARNLALEDLRHSRALVEIAGRMAQVGGWSVDLPDRRLVWSDVVAAIHDEPAGFSPSLDQGVGYYVPEHRGILRAAFDRCITDGTPYDLELEKITARGRRIWVRTIGQAERDAQGRIVRVQGAFQDVTTRRQNERATRELAERLRTTLESITDAFYTLNSDWRFTYLNGKAEGMFGRCREDLMGRVLWEQFPPILGTEFERGYRRAMAEKAATEFEGQHPPKDTWLHASVYPAKDGLTICLRDVTERKRAQQVLLESKEHFRLLHDLADTTRTLADPAQIMAATTRLLGEHLRASRCAYADVADDGEHFTILHDYTDGGASVVGSFLLSLFGARARTTLLNGQSLVIRDVDAELPSGDGAAMFNAIGIKAVICCPLVKGDGLRALMAVHQTTPRDWTERELATVQEVGERCWAAIERRNAEEKLHASEALLRIAGRAAHLGGWAVDLQDMQVRWSDEVCAILDMPPGTEPTLAQAFGFCVPQSVEAARTAFDVCARGGPPYALELEALTAQGRHLWLRCMGEAQSDATGAVTRVHGALQDITERRLAETALHASTERFRALSEAMPQIVWITRPDGWCIYVNQQWADYTGLDLQEALGLGWDKPFHADDRPAAGAAWQQAMATSGPYSTEARLRRADGAYRWWLVRGVPLRDAAGAVLKWIGTCTDVHDLKQAELRASDANEALRNSERRFSDLLKTVRLISVMLDCSAHITYCNDYLLNLTGWQRDEVIGRNWFELFSPKDSPAAADDFAAMLATAPESWQRENELLTRAGERRLIRWNGSVLRSATGEVIGSASIGEDVTEHARDQLALRELNAELEDRVRARTAQLNQAREEADQANQAKSAFLATMSHEIRTPMNGVIGMIEVLQQTSLKGQQMEMADLIRDSAFSLLDIIEDILDFSKIEAGRMDIAHEAMQLVEVVEKGCGMLAQMAARQGVRLSLFIDPAIPRIVCGDPGRVRQVLVNLVGNAIKFCRGREQPGQVSVRALLVDRQAASVTMELIVTDNGIGMSEATQARLFTPFSQADASTTRRFGGTGLGLAISDTLVRLMKGQISVRSVPGQGSTFTVRLPFALPALPALQAPVGAAAASTHVEGLHCRLVGAEQPLAGDLTATLRHAGVTVEHAPDLATAAAMARSPGLLLWLILPDQLGPSLADLRAMVPSGVAETQTCFVVLGHGARRRPRVEAPDLVTLDADVLARRSLFKALALAAGRVPQEATDDARAPARHAAVAPPRHEAQRQGRLILVAEDSETNRKVILHQLRLVGFAAEVCVNGCEALERWRSGDFALLLTDLHMPEMDGYELAAAIRGEEGARRHTPIIALTANALRDEELRCRAAGMDAYLTKPVQLPQLKTMLDTWLDPTLQAIALQIRAHTAGEALPPVDLSVLVELIGNDPAGIDEVLQAFRQSATQSGAELSQALIDGSTQAVADAAHKLKSAARSIGGIRLGQICAELEDAAHARRTDGLATLVPLFRAELQAVHSFLAAR